MNGPGGQLQDGRWFKWLLDLVFPRGQGWGAEKAIGNINLIARPEGEGRLNFTCLDHRSIDILLLVLIAFDFGCFLTSRKMPKIHEFLAGNIITHPYIAFWKYHLQAIFFLAMLFWNLRWRIQEVISMSWICCHHWMFMMRTKIKEHFWCNIHPLSLTVIALTFSELYWGICSLDLNSVNQYGTRTEDGNCEKVKKEPDNYVSYCNVAMVGFTA